MREIHTQAELQALVGHEVAVSDWMLIDQQRIQMFADATGDQQWIHTDVERCAKESPFGATVAHGFLSLSLIPLMMQETIHIVPARMGLNYGSNKVRFPAPLRAASRVRGRISLLELEEVARGVQLLWLVNIELENSEKPVCVAEMITHVYW